MAGEGRTDSSRPWVTLPARFRPDPERREGPKVRIETKLRLLALHVTNVAALHGDRFSESQKLLIRRSARLLRSVANELSPSVWNPRQRWDKLEARRAAKSVRDAGPGLPEGQVLLERGQGSGLGVG
jgi:hypothetical protein